MNGKKARAVKRTFGAKHIHEVRMFRALFKSVPRWVGGHPDVVRDRLGS